MDDGHMILAAVGRLEAKLDTLVETLGKHHGRLAVLEEVPEKIDDLEKRLRSVEQTRAQALMLALLVPIVIEALLKLAH